MGCIPRTIAHFVCPRLILSETHSRTPVEKRVPGSGGVCCYNKGPLFLGGVKGMSTRFVTNLEASDTTSTSSITIYIWGDSICIVPRACFLDSECTCPPKFRVESWVQWRCQEVGLVGGGGVLVMGLVPCEERPRETTVPAATWGHSEKTAF